MICPNCGEDSDAYEKNRAEREAGRKKEEEFERAYGHILRPIRRKRAWIGGIAGFVAGTLLLVIVEWSFSSSVSGGVEEFWEEMVRQPWYLRGAVLLMSLMPGMIVAMVSAQLARIRWSRQEKELRKSFGL